MTINPDAPLEDDELKTSPASGDAAVDGDADGTDGGDADGTDAA